MKLSPEQFARIEYLLTLFGDESISTVEMEELNVYLVESTEARQLYFTDTYLCSELQDGPLAKSVSQEIRIQAPRERRQRARKPKQKISSLWPYAAVALAAMFLLMLNSNGQAPSTVERMVIQEMTGLVSLDAAARVSAQVGAEYDMGTHVYVADGASCVVIYADKTKLTLRAGTHARFLDTSKQLGNKVVQVHRGNVYAEVSKQESRKPFYIHTDQAVVRVVGTIFDLQASEIQTDLELHHGSIEFTNKVNGLTSTLKAGQQISTAAKPELSPASAPSIEILDIQKQAIAIYRFDEKSGKRLHDKSVNGKALDLIIGQEDQVAWLEQGGLQILGVADILSESPAGKLSQRIQASNAFTIILSIQATHINDKTKHTGMDRILSLSRDSTHRNLSIGMGEMNEDPAALSLRLRRANGLGIDANGLDAFVTPAVANLRERQRTRVAVVKTSDGHLHYWVNQDLVFTQQMNANFSTWDLNYHLALAQEVEPSELGRGHKLVGSDAVEQARAWLGTFYHIEIYDQALSAAAVQQIFGHLASQP